MLEIGAALENTAVKDWRFSRLNKDGKELEGDGEEDASSRSSPP